MGFAMLIACQTILNTCMLILQGNNCDDPCQVGSAHAATRRHTFYDKPYPQDTLYPCSNKNTHQEPRELNNQGQLV